MKEFDLDKLERKTPYKVPENFFEEMQANVLKNTTNKEKKETKVFRLHFSAVTSIAAALALIFGFTFLWKTNQADITTPTNTDSLVSVKTPAKKKVKLELLLQLIRTRRVKLVQLTQQVMKINFSPKINTYGNSSNRCRNRTSRKTKKSIQ